MVRQINPALYSTSAAYYLEITASGPGWVRLFSAEVVGGVQPNWGTSPGSGDETAVGGSDIESVYLKPTRMRSGTLDMGQGDYQYRVGLKRSGDSLVSVENADIVVKVN
jgi:hypothetical protein